MLSLWWGAVDEAWLRLYPKQLATPLTEIEIGKHTEGSTTRQMRHLALDSRVVALELRSQEGQDPH